MSRSPGESEALGLLGLARRAGAVVTGVGATRQALGAGELGVVLFAADASEGQLEKIRGRLRHHEVSVRWVSERNVLGAALGEGPISAAGVKRGPFVARILERLSPTPPERVVGEPIEEQEKGGKHAGR